MIMVNVIFPILSQPCFLIEFVFEYITVIEVDDLGDKSKKVKNRIKLVTLPECQ